MRYEDIEVGDVWAGGAYEVTEAEIIEFAQQYDPQPFHVDPEAARASHFGGLVASGWHTCAITMRLLVENRVGSEGSLGSPGVDELRWVNPVRPGDVLSVRTEVTGKRASESLPGVGIVSSEVETHDQSGETKLTWESSFFVEIDGETDGETGS